MKIIIHVYSKENKDKNNHLKDKEIKEDKENNTLKIDTIHKHKTSSNEISEESFEENEKKCYNK